ncbi:MAG: bifunctional (p)ppGpp synthetase/guanosine-3',5'-bis(diphosphate) 3'-pyrophosphohydrolase [Proteobacteria bacterium]|jgi:GTP pyrophosphokinase|nr:bifunctional (p)ppGpp synthetase/guanosine-3',5'-bis(diphosphate) 3'-pyrophosphohydrolase [Pseudomonadota bacterium]
MVQLATQSASSIVLPADHSERWLASIAKGRSEIEQARIRAAVSFARETHKGQFRASGEEYLNHTMAVAAMLHELGLDTDTVIAGLLHDTVEDTDISIVELRDKFGIDVSRLVDGVTKMEVLEEYSEEQHSVGAASTDKGKHKENLRAASLRKMMLAMVDDVRIVLIKLCDRLHNMRTLGCLKPDKQKRIARETMDIYSPLANRLGVWQLKWELEDLSFRYIEPSIYKDIASKLSERRVDRHRYISDFVSSVSDLMESEGIHAEVGGRPKHIFSIWNKMATKSLDFEHIFDVRAVRVLVNSVQDCYAVLGLMHTNWNYISGKFDDYIATPKQNNYQSIHTAVVGPGGKIIEVQIRTHEMHEQNELGIAAHWQYKEGRGEDDMLDRKIVWLRQLLEWKDEVADANEFVDRVKDEVFEDRVYVFTPQGSVIDLARGATPVDFAYCIHTDLGHRCRGARVNGKMVPLTYKLVTGERVEIISGKNNRPSLDWLSPHHGYVNTQRARSKIQAWFRHENRDETLAISRQSLDRELERLGLQAVNHERLAQRCGLSSLDELCFKLADGSFKLGRAMSIAQKMVQPAPGVEFTPAGDASQGKALGRRVFKDKHTEDHGIQISGVGNLLTKLARCCNPLPGDEILGFLTQGRGVTVHRSNCKNLLHHRTRSPERVLEVQWGVQDVGKLPAKIHVSAYDRKGLLKDIAAVFADAQTNILEMNTQTNTADQTVNMFVTGEIDNIEVLSAVLTKLSQLSHVNWARRVSQ